jgi:hypothetical protein
MSKLIPFGQVADTANNFNNAANNFGNAQDLQERCNDIRDRYNNKSQGKDYYDDLWDRSMPYLECRHKNMPNTIEEFRQGGKSATGGGKGKVPNPSRF